jgi:hypothetical protein
MKKLLIVLLIMFTVSVISNAQDIRDKLADCYYCEVDEYYNTIYQTTYPRDTICIEKNDTLSNCVNGLTMYTFTPGSFQYYHTEYGCAISDTVFKYNTVYVYLKNEDSLYYTTGGASFLINHYKCSRISTTTSLLERIKNKSDIVTYPQPANNVLYVNAAYNIFAQSCSISLYDISGRLYNLPLTNIGNNTLQMDVKNLPAGMYILQLKTPDGIAVRKIVVARE